jgi:hypothetical protein
MVSLYQKQKNLENEIQELKNELTYNRELIQILQDHILFDRTNEVQSQDVTMEEAEVMQFADNDEGNLVGNSALRDEVMEDIDVPKYDLGDFLKRPVRIATYTIAQGEAFNLRQFRPWNLYFNRSSIRRKLDNYSYIQCDLKVKVVVNSTPFVYGMYAMSYRPLTNFSSQHDPIPLEEDRLILTQRPTIYIESHKNKGGEMTLPFFYHKNWLPLTSAGSLEMGRLDLYPIKSFESANGLATNPVNVLIYAWAENVKLAGNTVNLAIQSQDEYHTGPVSTVASAIAGVSRKLESVPLIGKFAKATTIGATATGAIASLFGFTDVPVIEDSIPMKDQPFHGFSSSQISAPVEKLTLDPKQELSISPSIAGLPDVDELLISEWAKRAGLLRVVAWLQSDGIDTSLFRCNVTPTLCRTIGSFPVQRYDDLPMGYCARLFQAWRGDIVIRVVLIKSQYHQGRLRVTYDPTGNIFSTPDSESVTMTKIVDIESCDYVEFTIPYTQPQSWLRVKTNVVRDNSSRSDSDSPYDQDFHNGRFEIRVLNNLTGPDTSADIGLAIFAYAKNFELANPTEVPFISSAFEVQSEDEPYVQYEMGTCTPRPSHIMDVNYGEDIRSLRTLMRRTCLHEVMGLTDNANAGVDSTYVSTLRIARNIYPLQYGFDPSGVGFLFGVNSVGAFPGNKTKNTPYTWLSPCFIGQRGGMNYSYNHLNNVDAPMLTVQRWNKSVPFTTDIASAEFDNPNTTANALDRVTDGIAGQALENERTQSGLQFYVPFVNRYKFAGTDIEGRKTGLTDDETILNNYVVSTVDMQHLRVGENHRFGGVLGQYHSIGADYTPLWFLSTITRWLYTTNAGN